MDLDHKVIGAWLRRARKRQRLTIKEMSERSGYSESFLSYLERGKRKANVEVLFTPVSYTHLRSVKRSFSGE